MSNDHGISTTAPFSTMNLQLFFGADSFRAWNDPFDSIPPVFSDWKHSVTLEANYSHKTEHTVNSLWAHTGM